MSDKLKKGWTKVAFGDVVRLSRERSRDPLSDGFERFIGLEHLDPEDLKIRRWGNVADGTTFTSVFRAGQVLFGKRRAYQKKLAVPDFDGVCSGDIYVLESKNGQLLPELLPFICQTDSFFDYAVGTSAGSLSPRTNWKSLAEYEFPLPPLDEQRRIAEVLKNSGRCREKFYEVLNRLQKVKRSYEARLIMDPLGILPGCLDLKEAKPIEGWFMCRGQDLLDKGYLLMLQDGNHGNQYPRSSEMGEEGFPYISAADISEDGDIELSRCRKILPERACKLRIPPANSGDVILTNNATVGRVTILPDWPTDIIASTSTTFYRCNCNIFDPRYLRMFFESSVFQYQLSTIMRQSTRNQVPITTQKKLFFAVPPFQVQKELAAYHSYFQKLERALRVRIQQLSQFYNFYIENTL